MLNQISKICLGRYSQSK